ncbi:class I SAM-dependent methyltransferase [Shimia sediminis]|uniref:class I SAM-dependent methyltransferase n=1 Tax=Shimia sediminis TaxID=2497945 RepID=UPI000F8D25E2|nr:class I SAM-dependent methyltransferase [Shimia sediminis]
MNDLEAARIASQDQTERIYAALWAYFCDFDAVKVLESFQAEDRSAHPDMVTNFLGTLTPPQVHPSILAPLAGTIEGLPLPGNWHADIAEWASALRSVELAGDTYRIVELDCGWGCWLTNMGVAARSRGLSVELIGIDVNASHLENARVTLEMNGFAGDNVHLHLGIAAPQTGLAAFPVSIEGESDWGGQAVFCPDEQQIEEFRAEPDNWQILNCFTLPQLSGDKPIDLLHIDIQGAECEFVEGNFPALSSHVKRVLIGTHSRSNEGWLFDWFETAGWRLEMDRAVSHAVVSGAAELRINGVQMWANPSFIND